MQITRMIVDDRGEELKSKTLITSDENTTGKTTFIRLILYSMGFNIPSTKKINFNKLTTRLFFEKDNKKYQFIRQANKIYLYKSDNLIDKYILPEDEQTILSYYSNISSPMLLDNFLGTWYFDQEEGWNWLSKGKVIGGNRFNLGEFIEGLMDVNNAELRVKIANNRRELRGYNLLKRNLEYRQQIETNFDSNEWNNADKLNAQLRTLELRISSLSKKVKDLENAQKSDEQFILLISEMKLRIKTKNGDEELVTADNICGFSSHRAFFDARLSILKRQLNKLLKEKANIQDKLKKFTKLFNMESQLDRFNETISELKIDKSTIDSIVNKIRKENRELEKKLEKSLDRNDYADKIRKKIIEFTNELGVSDYLDVEGNFVDLNEMKQYSGANLHLLAFATHLAYLYVLQEVEKEKYPIIIDSPFGREVTQENVQLMYNLLEKHFNENQIISASINDISSFTTINKKIVFENSMKESLREMPKLEENIELIHKKKQ
ncbi:hypothetical protein [Lactobacillus taiwanensis]|uniref:hypothetical protein n=1 Tax=Lactobacillus taiwanensis TaxID=508451 RepID=UPI00272D0921|nr:hypothetical protein [Lactobacillus taiwanensis]